MAAKPDLENMVKEHEVLLQMITNYVAAAQQKGIFPTPASLEDKKK